MTNNSIFENNFQNIFELLADNDKSVILCMPFVEDMINEKFTVIYGSFENLGLYDIYTFNDLFKYIDGKSEIPEVFGLKKYLQNLNDKINSRERFIQEFIPIKTSNTLVYKLKGLKLKDSDKCFYYLSLLDISLINLEQLYNDSYKDRLTKLFNRNALRMHTEGNEDKHFFGFFDLDGFKEINDTLSHSVGDELLSIVGEKIIEICDQNVVFYRYGGDEFVFMTQNLDEGEVYRLAEKILDLISRIEIKGRHVTASLGFTSFEKELGITPEMAIKLADIGMYHSKINGKNQITYIDKNWSNHIVNEVGLEIELDKYRQITKKRRMY